MGITRRAFIKGASGIAAAAWLAPRWSFGTTTLDPAPFEYGVASADPLPDGVVLWTRVSDGSSIVWFEVATSEDLSTIVASGSAPVGGDGTVVVDARGLPEPGRHYWYRFRTASGDRSVTGRTKTAHHDPARIRFAVASCQDFQAGFYHAWKHIAAQDIDFVMFLGDYIYEYGPGDQRVVPGRAHTPAHETITLADYRARYRHYRTDPALREAHRMHPWIIVWDDHEVANDRWSVPSGGAHNHDDSEGPYAAREQAALQAFFEYQPMRRPDPAEPHRIYRTFSFGALADLVMIDSRSYRTQPLGSLNSDLDPTANLNPGLSDPGRTLLGPAQKAWLKQTLRDSTARWKLVGNPIMFSHLNVARLPDVLAQPVADATGEPLPAKVHRDGLPINSDQWDGYKAEHREMLEFLRNPGGATTPAEQLTAPDRIRNVVFCTGDIHISWVMETYVDPGDAPAEEPVAAEFVGPGISSINLNERLGELMRLGRPLPHGISQPVVPAAIALNPHLRWADLDSNGYVLVDVDRDRARADYFFVVNPPGVIDANPVEHPDAQVARATSWMVLDGSSRILPAPPLGVL